MSSNRSGSPKAADLSRRYSTTSLRSPIACCTCRSIVTDDASARVLIQRPSRFSSPLTLASPIRPDVRAEMPTLAGRRIVVSLRAGLHRHAVALRRHAAQIENEIAGTHPDCEASQVDATEHEFSVSGAEVEMEIDRCRLVEAQTPVVLVAARR